MRACEGCRRRKIKCDAATSNNWPCSACLRLKLTCIRPNGYDGAPDTAYDPSMAPPDQFQQMQMHPQQQQPPPPQVMAPDPRAGPPMYAPPPPPGMYQEAGPSAYPNVQYNPPQGHPGANVHYGSMPPQVAVMDQHYAQQAVFPTPPPPMQTGPRQEPSPEAYTPDSFQQQDLADLLGSLKVDEKGTGMTLVVSSSVLALTVQPRIYEIRPRLDASKSHPSMTRTRKRISRLYLAGRGLKCASLQHSCPRNQKL